MGEDVNCFYLTGEDTGELLMVARYLEAAGGKLTSSFTRVKRFPLAQELAARSRG